MGDDAARQEQAELPRPTWASLPLVAPLALVALLVVVPVLLSAVRGSVTTMEESALLVYPQQLLDGQWPNRDFEHVYGPGNLWTLAAVYEVAGVSTAIERSVGVLYQLLFAAAVYGITRRYGRLVASGSALLAWLLISHLMGAHSSVGALALATAALWLSVEVGRAGSEARRRQLTFAAGLMAGLALSYRPDFFLAVVPAQLVLLRSGGIRRDPRWLAAGAGLGLVPLVVHVAVVGPRVALRGMLLDPALRHGSGRRLPVPPSFTEAPDSFTRIADAFGETSWMPWSLPVQFSVFFWSLIALVVVLGVVAWLRWRQDRETCHVHLAVACLAAGLLQYAMQRADPGHVALAFAGAAPFVPWAIGTRNVVADRDAAGNEELDEGAATDSAPGTKATVPSSPTGTMAWRSAAVATGCVAVVAVLGAPAFLGRPILDQYRRVGGSPDAAVVAGGQGRTLRMPEGMAVDVQQVVDYLEEHALPGERLVVGPAELRRTNYNESYLYYLLPDLEPATYHLEMNPGTANGSSSKLPEDLAAADWVVLSSRYDGWYERNESTELGSDAAANVVLATLEPVAGAGPYTVYQPRS